jgi:hypothetical protein
LQVAERLVRGFSVETVEAVQDVPEGFDAFIGWLCAIGDLSVNSNVMLAAVTENYSDANIMFRR